MYSFPIILHKSYYVLLDCLSVWGASGKGSWRVHLKGSAGLHSGQLYTFWQPAVQETGAVTSIFVFLKTQIFLYVINELQSPKAQQCFHLCVQVCAFFDDATLANSLPNGKRKRGLNDNRKGLDQNIVGAIKGMGGENTRDLICLFFCERGCINSAVWTVSSVYREILHWTQNREVARATRLGSDPSRPDQTCQEETEKRYGYSLLPSYLTYFLCFIEVACSVYLYFLSNVLLQPVQCVSQS